MNNGLTCTPTGGAPTTVAPAQYSAPSLALIKRIPVASVIPSTSNPLAGSLTFAFPAN